MLKHGDVVALEDNPTVRAGVVRTSTSTAKDVLIVDLDQPVGQYRKSVAIYETSGAGWKSAGYARSIGSPVFVKLKAKPKYIVLNNSSHAYSGDELILSEEKAVIKGNSEVALLCGDAVYKYVGRVDLVTLTEEQIPVEPGYRWTPPQRAGGPHFECEVIAVRGDYVFIQSFKDGVPQGCTTVRVSTIPKQTRPCNKAVKQLVKE